MAAQPQLVNALNVQKSNVGARDQFASQRYLQNDSLTCIIPSGTDLYGRVIPNQYALAPGCNNPVERLTVEDKLLPQLQNFVQTKYAPVFKGYGEGPRLDRYEPSLTIYGGSQVYPRTIKEQSGGFGTELNPQSIVNGGAAFGYYGTGYPSSTFFPKGRNKNMRNNSMNYQYPFVSQGSMNAKW